VSWPQSNPSPRLTIKLPLKIGGLGIRRIVDHAKGAFTASWHEAQGTTHESWTNSFSDSDCSTAYESQQKASSKTDATIMEKLKVSGNARDIQRLSRLDSPHANSWLSARPSTLDGKDTIVVHPLAASHLHSQEPCEFNLPQLSKF